MFGKGISYGLRLVRNCVQLQVSRAASIGGRKAGVAVQVSRAASGGGRKAGVAEQVSRAASGDGRKAGVAVQLQKNINAEKKHALEEDENSLLEKWMLVREAGMKNMLSELREKVIRQIQQDMNHSVLSTHDLHDLEVKEDAQPICTTGHDGDIQEHDLHDLEVKEDAQPICTTGHDGDFQELKILDFWGLLEKCILANEMRMKDEFREWIQQDVDQAIERQHFGLPIFKAPHMGRLRHTRNFFLDLYPTRPLLLLTEFTWPLYDPLAPNRDLLKPKFYFHGPWINPNTTVKFRYRIPSPDMIAALDPGGIHLRQWCDIKNPNSMEDCIKFISYQYYKHGEPHGIDFPSFYDMGICLSINYDAAFKRAYTDETNPFPVGIVLSSDEMVIAVMRVVDEIWIDGKPFGRMTSVTLKFDEDTYFMADESDNIVEVASFVSCRLKLNTNDMRPKVRPVYVDSSCLHYIFMGI